MSTLKKILSLSLALAMLMSVSVFAGFADAAEIDKDAAAAVELLTAVKILNGIPQEDGTTDFAPTATIKRGEAAKMIYVLRNGGVDDGAATWKGVVSFEDCKDHWAAGYIAYCEAYGLINGRTETVFDPEAPVTGIELAKMLLTTAGYKTDAEGFTGTGWEKNVVAEANAVNLFAGVKFAISEAAPRQWAAVMFKNAFDVTVPVYIGDYRVDGILNGVTPVKVKAQYLNYDDSLITYVLATATAAMPGEAKAASGKTTLASGSTVDFVVADALVGQQVKVTKINNKIVSIAATGKTVMGKLTIGAKVTASGENQNKYPIYIDGALWGYRAGDANLTLTNVAAGVTGIAASESKTVAALKTAIEDKTTAYTVYGYDKDGNNEALEAAIAVTTEYGKVGTISTATATKGDFAVGSYNVDVSSANVTVEGEMKKDIVVKVSKDMFTGKVTVAPADMVVGSFTGVSGSKYTVNGEQFEISAKAISGETSFLATTNLKKIAVLYTDGKYVVLAKEFVAETVTPDDPTELPANLAMLIAAQEVVTSTTSTDEWGNVSNTPTTVLKVQVLLADGTKVILPYETSDTIVKDADHLTKTELLAGATALVGNVFEYTVTTNAKILFKQTLPTVEDVNYYGTNAAGAKGAEVSFDTAKKLLTGIADTFIMATDNTKVFVKFYNNEPGKTAKTEYKVMKMADLVAYQYTDVMDGETVVIDNEIRLIAASDATIGEALLATATVSYKAPSSTTPSAVAHYVIATSAVDYVVEGDKIYKTFTAIDLKNNCAAATFKAEVKSSGTTDTTDVATNAILKIETTSGLVTKVETATGWTDAAITAKVADLILVNGETIWQTGTAFDSACKFIVKQTDGSYTAGTIASLVVAKKTNSVYNDNIKYALVGGTGTNKDKIAYVIIDLSK